jgi:hypothetical protein
MLSFSLPPNTDIVAAVLTVIVMAAGAIGWLLRPHRRRLAAIRDLLRFLEDKRVLYDPMAFEDEDYSASAILQIRAELQAAAKEFRDGDLVMFHLKGMQQACHAFLNRTGSGRRLRRMEWERALQDLRIAFAEHMTPLYDFAGVSPAKQVPAGGYSPSIGEEGPPIWLPGP